MNIPQQVYQDLKREGYSDQEITSAYQDVQREEQRKVGVSATAFQYSGGDNLVKWQLDVNEMLEKAEHLLREDIVSVEQGQVVWKSNPNPKNRTFSEYGIQELLRVLSMYLNRITILSDYEPDEINAKVYDFGTEVSNLIFMKYEDFGLTSLEKRKNYPMLVRELIDIVHSAYKRALYGGERDSLRTARQIAQQEHLSPSGNINVNTGQPLKPRGLLNPARYLLGKYK